jgi:hypothetical protein
MGSDEIQFSNPRPLNSAEVNSTELARHRRELAEKLRTDHPGQWAVISEGHTSIKSAGVVRRRLREQSYWAGFEMTSRKAENGEGFCIHARYMGKDNVLVDIDTDVEADA